LQSMDSSEFHEFLAARSSVRNFRDEPVPEEDIMYILDCASTAPSAGNLEAWDVVLVDDRGIREELSDAAYSQEHVRDAPNLLVVCANYIRSMSRYGERGILYALQDATIACTYMMLAAHARRLHTCWVGHSPRRKSRQFSISRLMRDPLQSSAWGRATRLPGSLNGCPWENMSITMHGEGGANA